MKGYCDLDLSKPKDMSFLNDAHTLMVIFFYSTSDFIFKMNIPDK